jgi:iron complex outermembrane recepter protein
MNLVSNISKFTRAALCAGSALQALTVVGAGVATIAVSAPAMAQATSADAPTVEDDAIVVTGSILRTADKITASPVTSVSVESLDQRGISTIQDGLQQLASNNGPALTNSFTANGAFAGGASAVSLRGLSTNSTLVLFDGLRASYYPLADDGARNFVDLNTIPDDIVDKIEVLRDGASSSYGADAIAGVVNIITKRQFQGIGGRAEGGITGRGDAPSYRLSLTAGFGDLANQGFNVYVSGFYNKSTLLKDSQRPYPFNSSDLRNVVAPDGTAGPDNRVNAPSGFDVAGGFNPRLVQNFLVRPYDATNTTALGRFQALGACNNGTPYTLNAAQLALNTSAPQTACVVDTIANYGIIQPNVERFGGSARATVDLGGDTEAYGQVNFLQTVSTYTGNPANIFANGPVGILFPRFSTVQSGVTVAPGSFPLTLPVFVCPQGVGSANGLATGCDATNGALNPQNPFAAQGQVARLIGNDLSSTTSDETRNRTYRAALGIRGNITSGITFDVNATAVHTDLRRTQNGRVFIANLLTAIARGGYNFANPSANTQAQQDFLRPNNITGASSDLYQLQAVFGAKLLDLPGGELQAGLGGTIFYEAVDAPSANADNFGPTQRFFGINAFGTTGNRTVKAVFGELNAPIIEQLTLNAGGRYDSYSSGQSSFSPKVGFKFQPIKQLVLRGTYSRGFRIPSFAEANALPTTGFVSNSASNFNDTYLRQYGCTVATFSTCPTYIRNGAYGQTTLASPNLNPEKSRSFTAGILIEPVRGVSFTVDYYNIKKTGSITQPSNAPALAAYYGNLPIPAGYTVTPDAVDPNNPTARPRIALLAAQLINANTNSTSGIDVGINVKYDFGAVKFSSNLDATYILKLETIFPDGTRERYDGTLGNFNLTAGSGTPKIHANWVNSIEFDNFQVNGTVNFFGGYDLSAQDQGTGYKDGGLNPGYSPTGNRVPNYVTFDLGGRIKVNDKFSFTFNVLNLIDRLPPIDVVTYGANLYNPVQGGNGILGRSFKAGVKFGL